VYSEHIDFLSWFSDRRESHEQDGEKLPFASSLRIQTASSDPAMAIGLPVMCAGTCPSL
jgi:hypothetical protein